MKQELHLQDANECWSELLKMLQQQLPALKNSAPDGPSFRYEMKVEKCSSSIQYRVRFVSSFIDQYFGGTFDVEMKCAEAPDEPSTSSRENFLQLSCFISQEVKYMLSGLKSVK